MSHSYLYNSSEYLFAYGHLKLVTLLVPVLWVCDWSLVDLGLIRVVVGVLPEPYWISFSVTGSRGKAGGREEEPEAIFSIWLSLIMQVLRLHAWNGMSSCCSMSGARFRSFVSVTDFVSVSGCLHVYQIITHHRLLDFISILYIFIIDHFWPQGFVISFAWHISVKCTRGIFRSLCNATT